MDKPQEKHEETIDEFFDQLRELIYIYERLDRWHRFLMLAQAYFYIYRRKVKDILLDWLDLLVWPINILR